MDITLKFTPGANVDAELIGLTQTANTIQNNKPTFLTKTVENRSIKSTDAKVIGGQSDEGVHIDRASAYNNPIYPVDSQPSTSLDDTSTSAGWGQNGWRYVDASKTLQTQDALLIDGPRYNQVEKDSAQIFETTALATKGVQVGTYYGSVRWGWRTDDKGNFTKLPLSVVSLGVPSSTFMKAAELWNASKSSNKDDTVDLPIVQVMKTKNSINLVRPVPMTSLTLSVGTRLQIVQGVPLLNTRVKVVDGPHTGQVGEIMQSEWTTANVELERP